MLMLDGLVCPLGLLVRTFVMLVVGVEALPARALVEHELRATVEKLASTVAIHVLSQVFTSSIPCSACLL